jgi:hypothetical protein
LDAEKQLPSRKANSHHSQAEKREHHTNSPTSISIIDDGTDEQQFPQKGEQQKHQHSLNAAQSARANHLTTSDTATGKQLPKGLRRKRIYSVR